MDSSPRHSSGGGSARPDDFPVIEGYDIIDVIGRGGMGAVYEAFQQSTGRRVAVKLMLERAGANEAARRRFEREVELVARLSHPNIVSILDSGLHRSRYFYVMEHVEGRPLDEAQRPGECEPRSLLGVMARVARAVDYAHQRGVMHRDLKPGNILVDERGEPRLLDFGLAKAFDPHSLVNYRESLSEPGQVIGTLGYMPPEQARGAVGEISVRSDVYSLGAIAYELLTGRLPCAIDGPMALVFQRIESRDPDRPSAHRKQVDADIDAVLLKALEKEPGRRYATAGEFADDLDRWLGGRPVRARRVSAPLRAARWCRRNPAPAATIVALVLLVASMGVAMYLQSGRERAQAFADSVDRTMLDTLESLDPDKGPGMAEVARPMFERVEGSLAKTPRPADREAEYRERLGELYRKWSLADRAVQSHERALGLQRRLHGAPHADVARCLRNLGGAHFDLWQLGEAERCCRESMEMRRSLAGGTDDAWVADSMNYLAQTLGRMRRFDEAERLQQRVIEIRRAAMGDDSEGVAAAINNFATLRKQQGDFEGAERRYRDALERLRRSLDGKPHRFIATSLRNIAVCMMERGVLDGVEPLLLEARRVASDFYGPESREVASAGHDLACLRLEQGRFEEALRLGREVHAFRLSRRGPNHPEARESALLIARILVADGRSAEGEAAAREAMRALEADQPSHVVSRALAQCILGDALASEDRHAEAIESLSAAYPALVQEFGAGHKRSVACLVALTRSLRATGQDITPERLSAMLGSKR